MKKKHGKEKDNPVNAASGKTFEDLPGLDVTGALKRLNVNMEIYVKSLAAFAEDYARIIDKIKDALNRKDVLEARKLLHTLRGSAGNIGANEVETAGRMLRNAVKEGKIDLDSLVEELELALELTLKSIRSITDNNDSNSSLTQC